MDLKRKIIGLIAAFAALCIPFTVCADETDEDETSVISVEDSNGYITSGDFQYSLNTDDDGNQIAFLEKYTGDETKVTIPEEIDGYKVTGLGDQTFTENEQITEITISANLENFGYYPFYGCTSLMEFKVNEDNPLYTADKDGVLVRKDGLSLIAYPVGKKPESYTVADGTILINASAFAMCSSLKEINFPDSLKIIDYFAFSECTSLESLKLPDNVTELGTMCFSTCTSLKSVELPENLQKLGDAAFFKCESLETIEFPPNLTSIGQAAFCSTGLTSITIPATITSIGYSAFGFHTDENDNFEADENFVIMGYKGSYAQTYSSENDISFVSLDEEVTEAPSSDKSKNGKIPSGTIIGFVIGLAAVLVIVIVLVTVKGSSKEKGDDENEEDDTEDTE